MAINMRVVLSQGRGEGKTRRKAWSKEELRAKSVCDGS